MHKVFVENTNIITSLGITTEEVVENMLKGECGLKIVDDNTYTQIPTPLSLIDRKLLFFNKDYTTFENLLILSIEKALEGSKIDITSDDTIIILSSTKGNIDLLEKKKIGKFSDDRIYLWKTAEIVANHFKNKNEAITVSNACISGVLALNLGRMLISSGKYKNAIVAGGDILSEFVIAGFQSFQSLSPQACKPFDEKRDGLSLGEGFGTVILSSSENGNGIQLTGGAGSNDANHISGPSRTGDGLYYAINSALKESLLDAIEIDFLSAHGTATDYNDEMEAKAFSLAMLEHVPMNSFKGYFGHTLGAAGIIEAVLTVESMKGNTLYKCLGFENLGVSKALNIIKENKEVENIRAALKTASGFGGCNAAVVFEKL